MRKTISSKLAVAYVSEQANIALQQEGLASGCGVPAVSLSKGEFYVKSLASLSVCSQLLLNNAQLKEMNYNKIKMLHSRISEVALRIQNFKTLLKLAANNPDNEQL